MLMYPKDKIDPSLKKDVVYQWSCTNPGCKSSYTGETSRSLCERVKEHSKEGSNSAMYQHFYTKAHPLPNVDQFKVIDQEKPQIARKAKEAIHIRKEDPELNRNVGKMLIPVKVCIVMPGSPSVVVSSENCKVQCWLLLG